MLGQLVIAMHATLAQRPTARGPLGVAMADPHRGGVPIPRALAPLSTLLGTMPIEDHLVCSLAAAHCSLTPIRRRGFATRRTASAAPPSGGDCTGIPAQAGMAAAASGPASSTLRR